MQAPGGYPQAEVEAAILAGLSALNSTERVVCSIRTCCSFSLRVKAN